MIAEGRGLLADFHCRLVASMKTRVWVAAGIATVMFSASLQLLSTGAATSARSVQAFELNKGVIVDPARGVVCLMNPEHGIDATELASGKLLWHTTIAAEPFLLFDKLPLGRASCRW